MQVQERTPFTDRLLLKVPEAADATGYAASFLWRLIQRGELPAVRVGRSVRIRRDDLEQFIEAHRSGGDDA
ncbi:hypothetical protein BH24CHL1_BH24CHL1_14050 [soil metagenome]